MKVFHNYRIYVFILVACVVAMLFGACSKDEPDGPQGPQFKTSILLYAVASNNLNYNFSEDLEEIRNAGPSINLDEADVVIYSVRTNEDPQLRRMVRNADGSYGFRTLKQYSRDMYSTDPKRISEVIADYQQLSTAGHRGLILWSHGSGWTPKFADHMVEENSAKDAPIKRAFGQDKYNDKSDYCDITELADAIPSQTFDFIWFDCCYMMSIEVLYQIRDKADYFIGSPNELVGEGMPYNLTLPFLAKENFSILGAVDAEVSYFRENNCIFAMSIADASALEDIAMISERAVRAERPGAAFLYNYARRPDGPFYDFGQYQGRWGANLGEEWDEKAFQNILDRLVIYKASSSRDFSNKTIPGDFSGISVHYFQDTWEDEEEYYKTLDWFKAVYTTVPEF